jgi:hypothetical protein
VAAAPDAGREYLVVVCPDLDAYEFQPLNIQIGCQMIIDSRRFVNYNCCENKYVSGVLLKEE